MKITAIGAPLLLLGCLFTGAARAQNAPGTLGCDFLESDWNRMSVALSKHNYYETFRDTDCPESAYPNAASLTVRYNGCTKTLRELTAGFASPVNCDTHLASIIYSKDQTQDEILSLAAGYCGDTLSNAVKFRLCDPLDVVGCPRALQFAVFAPFANCFTPVINMSLPEATRYFQEGQDLQCIKKGEVCKTIDRWKTCPIRINDVFVGLDKQGTWTCAPMFKGAPPETCGRAFDEAFTHFCPEPTWLEKNTLSLALGLSIGPVAIVLLILCCRRIYTAEHISHEDLVSQSMMSMNIPLPTDGSGSTMQSKAYIHPEMHAAIAKVSKFKGVVYNEQLGQWGANGVYFADEQEAARAAYQVRAARLLQPAQYQGNYQPQYAGYQEGYQQQGGYQDGYGGGQSSPMMGNNNFAPYPQTGYPSPSLMTPQSPYAAQPGFQAAYQLDAPVGPSEPMPENSETKLQRRKAQLRDFYEYWDPEKADIAAHVDNLFARHDFAHVARAVQTKYGLLPPGWDAET